MKLERCFNIDDLRRMARRRLPRPIYDFLEGGADDEWSVRENGHAFDRYALSTRTLVDIGRVDTGTRLLGQTISCPLVIAPTGANELFHYTAETAVARAAGDRGVFFMLSTMSNTSLEDIAGASQGARALQLYVFKDRARTESLVRRSREAGYQALCLTVDTPLSGNRERDRVNGMGIPPRWTPRSLFGFATRPRWSLNAIWRCRYALANFSDIGALKGTEPMAYVNSQFDRTLTWSDAAWLRQLWDGPFVVKGILSADDARRAVDVGATAVWVSNHGGRQLDGTVAPVDCLPAIRAAVGPGVEIVVDGGIRRGTHMLKALALGANACAIGRPYLYGLAAAGYRGVVHALDILRAEFERGMALAGCASIADIGPQILHRAD